MPTSLMFQHKMSSLHGCDTQNYLVALVKRKGSWSKSTMSQLIDTLHFSLEILKSYFLISLTICNNELSFFYKNSNCRKESLNCCPLMNFLWKLYVWRISTCRTSMEKNFKNAQKTHKALFLFLLRMKFAYFAKVAFIKCFKLMDNCMNFGYFEIVAIIKYSKLIGISMKFGYFAKVAIIKYLKFVGPLCAKTLKNLTCSHTSNHEHAI